MRQEEGRIIGARVLARLGPFGVLFSGTSCSRDRKFIEVEMKRGLGLSRPLGFPLAVLAEQLQDGLRREIGLSQHCSSRGLQDLVPGEVGHLKRHVYVPDT